MLKQWENSQVFHPLTARQSWLEPPSADIQDVFLTGADGSRLHAWWCQADSPSAILYLHGNAGNLSQRGPSLPLLRSVLNASVFIIDYPGYGKSEGSPTETGCYEAGNLGYNWLTQYAKIMSENLIIYGGSLGGAVAIELARQREHRALILVKTFTSLPDVASQLFPWLPVRWLMSNRFDNLAKIGECHRPVFIASATDDRLVPYEQGRRLFEAANEPKEFFALRGNDHGDPLPAGFFDALRAFLERIFDR